MRSQNENILFPQGEEYNYFGIGKLHPTQPSWPELPKMYDD